MKYNYILGTHNSEVVNKMQTEQFELSEILMDKRFELSLEFEEIAEIAGFSPQEYIELEYGESNIPIESYRQAIRNIDSYKTNRLLNIDISKKTKQISIFKSLYSNDSSTQDSDFDLENIMEMARVAQTNKKQLGEY